LTEAESLTAANIEQQEGHGRRRRRLRTSLCNPK